VDANIIGVHGNNSLHRPKPRRNRSAEKDSCAVRLRAYSVRQNPESCPARLTRPYTSPDLALIANEPPAGPLAPGCRYRRSCRQVPETKEALRPLE
jgi:hypothetical protein